ncbi:type II toxin-antitoxin system Phd/YefM family antitoxin [Patescibacteria group bacterium]|nr:type II toxin-antitoxin system Phd/YefM family antitoxin [Patescibacteria group bacterium]MBU1721271.1 type II toxin-antitoxin system Phd/YefM family antitoxin [Patescibacteria group bacterium]MBU1901021.1 type II toxin-antitoxin system Phd/YefM family antitoxin [Patescibacteria group bacterium]
METISITHARKNIFDITDMICEQQTQVTLTEYGKAKVVMMSADEFHSWQQTMKLVKKDLAFMAHTKNYTKAIRAKTYIDLEEALQQQGFVVADKTKQAYATNKTPPKRKKRS